LLLIKLSKNAMSTPWNAQSSADAGYIQLQTPSISPNALAAIGASGIPTQIAPQPPNEFSGHFLQHGRRFNCVSNQHLLRPSMPVLAHMVIIMNGPCPYGVFRYIHTQSLLPDQADDTVVSVNIPYFGIVKIASQGMSKEVCPYWRIW
jgi:hypothetical protein